MTFGQSISSCYANYATFSGRASRSEHWFFTLYQALAMFVAVCLIPLGIGIVAVWVLAVANFLPSLSVIVRRLHDTDRSGWWYWILLIPLVGAVLMFIWFCTRGTDGPNNFGSDPLESERAVRSPLTPSPPAKDIVEELSKLAKLRADGTISEEEFQRLKTKLI